MSLSDVDHGMTPTLTSAARDVRYHGVASLTFLVWNLLMMLDREVEYVWTMRNKSPFKWVYLFLRYVVILAHVTHNLLITQLARGTNPTLLCNIWYIYALVSSQTLSSLLEFILASRVFALYNRSKRVAFLLLILILTEAAGTTRILSMRRTPKFCGTCLLLQPSEDYNYQSMLGFIVHCTLIGLTWFKYYFALRAGWGRTPLVSLVVRDGSTVYATVVILLVSVVIISGSQNERGIAIVLFVITAWFHCALLTPLWAPSFLRFSWATSLMSVSGCRMILSMERFARRNVSIEPPEPLFTSEFSVGTVMVIL